MKQQRDSLGFLVSDVARLMRRAFERQIEGSSLTLAQARALVYVSRNEGIRQVDLADLLEVQPMTLARLVDQLEAEGLIERRNDPVDRRAFRVFLKAAASLHLDAIDRAVVAVRKTTTRELDRDRVAAVVDALKRMRDNLSDR